MRDARQFEVPVVVHLVRYLALGGLEHGLVNLINNAPPERYRHVVLCQYGSGESFRRLIRRPDTSVVSLEQRRGLDILAYRRLWTLLRQIRPLVLHTRNLPCLDAHVVAAAAGVPLRIHGEHGREMNDLEGHRLRYVMLRKAMRPFIHHYTCVSRDLAGWLAGTIGVPPQRVTPLSNGVDLARFHPRQGPRPVIGPDPSFAPPGSFVIGTVGRMQAVKDQLTLVRAFVNLLARRPALSERARLAIVGPGPLRERCEDELRSAGAAHLAWLPGDRTDIPELLRSMDLFVLPSLAEGMSNTVLEAMASGLPVIATKVGGNPEIVDNGGTGLLIPPSDPETMAEAIAQYMLEPGLCEAHGRSGRARAEAEFSLAAMAEAYLDLYDRLNKEPRAAPFRAQQRRPAEPGCRRV